jgi:hypothetical protein
MSKQAIETRVCAICARDLPVLAEKVTTTSLAVLPNFHRLVPHAPHDAHDLYFGCLLQPEGVQQGLTQEQTQVTTCQTCRADLRNPSKDPPRLSLANNMWVGRVPWQLSSLTLPEQMLIALLFPRVYVFKLYPKILNHMPDQSSLQRAMRGTVSTYEMKTTGVADMVEGRLMPRPPAILASLISITFISKGQPTKNWLQNTFRVRRKAVARALDWLKANNPKYYGEIEVSMERLQELPEDGVPLEIEAVIHETTDTTLVEEESTGYVMEHEMDGLYLTPQ